MVKPLTFKGDKKAKKRKRDTTAPPPAAPPQPGDFDAADDCWVSADGVGDVVGPVMLVLPTSPPAALACDSLGSVYGMVVENIVDGHAATAEPHDVRMVWVASRLAGSTSFRFKGHHGRYLASDKTGHLSATSEAVSPLETFSIVAAPDTPGTFHLSTHHDTFITATAPDKLRTDAEAMTDATALHIRMQARFKPRIKAERHEQAQARISRRELDEAAGRRLTEDEVRMLKRARREGDYHEKLLDVKVKGKHDKFA